jgi:hypothetical protein
LAGRGQGLSWKEAGGPSIGSAKTGPRAKSAHTKFSNNAQTDQEAEVMHEVTMDDGTVRDIMAADPLDAMKRAERQ